MKPRDYIINQINHRETDIIPYTLSFEGDLETQLDDYYGDAKWRNTLQAYMKNVSVVDTMKKTPTEQAGHEVDLFGTVWRTDLRPFHLITPGMKNPTFNGYTWPDPQDFFVDEKSVQEAQAACVDGVEDLFIVAYLGWGLFETGWGIRGFENIMMDMALQPAFYEELLDKITEQFLSYVDFTCKALPQADAIMFGDDWGHQRGVMAGPDRWKKLFKQNRST